MRKRLLKKLGMNVRHVAAQILVYVAALSVALCSGCSANSDFEQKLDEMATEIEQGVGSLSAYNRLALLPGASASPRVIRALERELERNPQNLAAAYTYYAILLADGQLSDARTAADGFYRAACGDCTDTSCSEADGLFYTSVTQMFLADVCLRVAEDTVSDEAKAQATKDVDRLSLKAIHAADQLDAAYVRPVEVEQAIPMIHELAPALMARAGYVGLLLEQGRIKEARRLADEGLSLCPEYHPVELCEKSRRQTDMTFSIHRGR